MGARGRWIGVMAALVVVLVAIVVGARVLGSRSTDRSATEAEAKLRADGFVNHLAIANMLDVPIRLSVGDLDPTQWGRIAPDDEPPAGLQAEVIDAQRVSGDVGLRPLRIVDGGGDATFTLGIWFDPNAQARMPVDHAPVLIGNVPTRSTSIEYCSNTGKCFDGYGYFDWQDAPDPALDVFRRCEEVDRVIGTYVDRMGVTREAHVLFQCDATKFRTTLVIHS